MRPKSLESAIYVVRVLIFFSLSLIFLIFILKLEKINTNSLKSVIALFFFFLGKKSRFLIDAFNHLFQTVDSYVGFACLDAWVWG